MPGQLHRTDGHLLQDTSCTVGHPRSLRHRCCALRPLYRIVQPRSKPLRTGNRPHCRRHFADRISDRSREMDHPRPCSGCTGVHRSHHLHDLSILPSRPYSRQRAHLYYPLRADAPVCTDWLDQHQQTFAKVARRGLEFRHQWRRLGY